MKRRLLAALVLGLAALVRPAGAATGAEGYPDISLKLVAEKGGPAVAGASIKVFDVLTGDEIASEAPLADGIAWREALYSTGVGGIGPYRCELYQGGALVDGAYQLTVPWVTKPFSAVVEVIMPGAPAAEDGITTVTVKNHAGVPIAGVPVKAIVNSAWITLDPTNGSGQTSDSRLKQNVPVYATIGGVTAVQKIDDKPLTFYTTAVTVRAETAAGDARDDVSVKYIAGSAWQNVGTVEKTIEIFGTSAATLPWYGTVGGTTQIINKVVLGDTTAAGLEDEVVFQTKVVTITTLKSDDSNSPLAGVSIKYIAGSAWHVPGSGITDDAGQLTCELFDGTFPFYATYRGTQAVQNIKVDGGPVAATFYAAKVTVEAIDNDGAAVAPTTFKYIAGSAWWTIDGSLTADMFGGTYDFYATHRGMTKSQSCAVGAVGGLTESTDKVTFTLTNVTLFYNATGGSIKYIAGSAWWTVSSGVQFRMFAGSYPFYFGHSGAPTATCSLTVEASALKKSIAIVKVANSKGQLIKAAAKYRSGSAWVDAVDGGSNLSVAVMPYTTGSVAYGVSLLGAWTEKSQSLSAANGSIVTFQTKAVTMKLAASTGVTITDGVSLCYREGSSWKTFAPVNGAMEMLPVNIAFGVSYRGAWQEKSQNVGTNPAVVFQAKAVTMQLLASNGATLTVGVGLNYREGSSWKTFAPVNGAMEMLPVNIAFGVSYRGAWQEKSQNVGTNPAVTFQTVLVTVTAPESAARYYRESGKWVAFTPDEGKAGMEMLPVNIAFGISNAGKWSEKSQNVGTNANVVFP